MLLPCCRPPSPFLRGFPVLALPSRAETHGSEPGGIRSNEGDIHMADKESPVDQLRRDILSGLHAPGERLIELDLSETIRLWSRTPCVPHWCNSSRRHWSIARSTGEPLSTASTCFRGNRDHRSTSSAGEPDRTTRRQERNPSRRRTARADHRGDAQCGGRERSC